MGAIKVGRWASLDFDREQAEFDAKYLDGYKNAAKRFVDDIAEHERQRLITPGPGQALVYLIKVNEAEAIIGDNNPQTKNYPMLAASIGLDGDTLVDVAAVVRKRDSEWKQSSAFIEGVRLHAKHDIQLAANAAGVTSVLQGLTWSP
jgi:hypothetical protein